MSQESGNTNPIPSNPQDEGRGKYAHAWCGTWNLGTKDSDFIKSTFGSDFSLWSSMVGFQVLAQSQSRGVAQLEEAETGQIHIQMYVEFEKRKRLLTLKREFGNTYHWEARKGPREKAIQYCVKSESRIGPVFSWCNYGEPLRLEYPSTPPPLRRITMSEMRGWQRTVIDEAGLEHPCEHGDRTVTYVWSPFGRVGKSMFAVCMVDRHDQNWLLVSGGTANIAFMIKTFMENAPSPELAYLHGIVIDIPRCRTNDESVKTISAPAIESIKNGCVFSSKYDCAQLRFNTPHVVVMSNAEPPVNELSTDRWRVYQLDEQGNIEGRD